MISKISSATLHGIQALPITIEVNVTQNPQPRFSIVGLPDNAVRESQERVISSLTSNGYKLQMRQIVVNLAPADLKKEGSGFDLPIAIGILMSMGLIKEELTKQHRMMFAGELSLDGIVQPIRGALPIAVKARELGYDALFVPEANVREAAVVNKLKVYGINHLLDIIGFLNGTTPLEPTIVNTREEFYAQQNEYEFDFGEVRGQENVKRAFEVAAAGGHNIILIGSPGCGKSMMAKRLPSILPPLSLAESLETTNIYSIAGKVQKDTSLISQRPFRAPHHTISDIGLIGGSSQFTPGEVSLAHNGVLYLDEVCEYSKTVLETLRQPLEDRQITISRAKYTHTLPCSFMLVASTNPCPCGYHHHPTHPCVCTPAQVQRYMSKISGPLMDRIDIQVEVESLPLDDMMNAPKGESSAAIRERVIKARKIQEERYKDTPGIYCNAQMTTALLRQFAQLDEKSTDRLRNAMSRLNLSARAYDRILKVARTIADLDGCEDIKSHHIGEAIGYRNLDRDSWIE